MGESQSAARTVCHYFVDEAGDATLFGTRGKVIVGSPGCSSHFIVGVLDVADPIRLMLDLNNLRAALVADPFFRRIPSMRPEAKKTAVLFHATDDLPEVRRDVFKILENHQTRFFAIVRNKAAIAEMVLKENLRRPTYKYHPNQLYDVHVQRLFRDRLHEAENVRACFARRGNSDRTAALNRLLLAARSDFRKVSGVDANSAIEVTECASAASAGLQAADYFLWALQRLYAKGEDRYLDFLYRAVIQIHDTDDTRNSEKGEYYSQENRLSVERIKRSPGI